MKHYFSFLLLSLFVFLSLVCSSPVMAADTVLDFTWTSTDSNNMPADGSFSFSGKVDDAIKSWGDNWVGFGSNVTATSRSQYPLTKGTNVFTLKVKSKETLTVQVPKIVINNGSDIVCSRENVKLPQDEEVDLKYSVEVPSDGDYTIKVVSVHGERDKFGIRLLTIPSDPTPGAGEPTCPELEQRTITFEGGDNAGGSMSNMTAICSGEDRMLPANGFTKTDHSFTGWIANVDVKINGATVTAGTLIADGATIQDITQNITLTAQWTPAAGKTVLCSLGFYYTKTGGKDGKEILDSDFSYSCNKDYAKNDQHTPNKEVCFSGSGPYTLTSRMEVYFPQAGTYKFTFPLFVKYSGSYDAPCVTVNGQQSASATITTTKNDEKQNYETTLNVTTAGTYTVSVWIGETNEKVFFSIMDITSDQSGNIISSLPWDGSQDLTEGTVVSAQAISSCFDTEITFTFEGGGTVQYYDNSDPETSLGEITSGTAITLTDD